jgi:hypothetical protein
MFVIFSVLSQVQTLLTTVQDEDGTFLIACSEDGLFSKWVLNPQGQFVLEGRAESKAGDARDFTVVPAELQAVVLTDKCAFRNILGRTKQLLIQLIAA